MSSVLLRLCLARFCNWLLGALLVEAWGLSTVGSGLNNDGMWRVFWNMFLVYGVRGLW